MWYETSAWKLLKDEKSELVPGWYLCVEFRAGPKLSKLNSYSSCEHPHM